MKKGIIWSLCLIHSFIFSQHKVYKKIDSLQRSLAVENLNSRYKTLLLLNDEYSNIDLKKAIFYGNQSLKIAKQLKKDAYVATSYNLIANTFQYQSNLDSALFYHQKAFQIRKKLKDSLGMADSYNNIGIVYDAQAQFQEAIMNYFKALFFYEKKGDLNKQAMTLTNIGIVYKAQKEYQKAFKYYMRAYTLYSESKSDLGITISSGNLGSILINFQKYKESLYYSNKALKGYLKLGYSRYLAYPLASIAIVYDSLNKFDKANKNYIEAIQLHDENKNLFELSETANAYSNCLIKQKRYKEAIVMAQKASFFAQKSESNLMEVFANNNLAKAFAKLGDFKNAYLFSSLYEKGKDVLFKNEKTKAIFEIETKYQTQKKEKMLLEKEIESKQKNIVILVVSLLAFFVGIIGYLIFRQQKIKNKQQEKEFELKTAISQIETQNKLQEQRLTISRDLHDNIGAQLTFIISSVENIKYGFDIPNQKMSTKLSSVSEFTKATIIELRDTIWAMNNDVITFENLKFRILNFIEKAKLVKENIQFEFVIQEDLTQLEMSSIVGMNMYRVIQEAINNAIKYANATTILVSVNKTNNQLYIIVKDNGKGFDIQDIELGNGLNNIKKRGEEIKANVDIKSQLGIGTQLSLNMALSQV